MGETQTSKFYHPHTAAHGLRAKATRPSIIAAPLRLRASVNLP